MLEGALKDLKLIMKTPVKDRLPDINDSGSHRSKMHSKNTSSKEERRKKRSDKMLASASPSKGSPKASSPVKVSDFVIKQ